MSKGLHKFIGRIFWSIFKIIDNKISDLYNFLVFFSGSTFILWLVLRIFAANETIVILSLSSWWLLIFLSYGLLTAKTKMEAIKRLILFMYHKFSNAARLIGSTIVILLFIASFFNRFSFITNDFLNVMEVSESGLFTLMLTITTVFIIFVPLIISIFIITAIIMSIQMKLTGQNKTPSKISIIFLVLCMLFIFSAAESSKPIIKRLLNNNLSWLFTISLFGLHLNYLVGVIRSRIYKRVSIGYSSK